MVIKNIVAILFLAIFVYGFSTYFGEAKSFVFSLLRLSEDDVKGASTQRAESLSGQLRSDVGQQVSSAKEQALQVTFGDIVSSVYRLQQIPQHIHGATEYLKGQLGNMVESR